MVTLNFLRFDISHDTTFCLILNNLCHASRQHIFNIIGTFDRRRSALRLYKIHPSKPERSKAPGLKIQATLFFFPVFSTLEDGVAEGGERLPQAEIASPFRRKG
jgi:hypothetical protein